MAVPVLTPAVAPKAAESLAERYAIFAQTRLERRRVDIMLRPLDIAISASALLLFTPIATKQRRGAYAGMSQ